MLPYVDRQQPRRPQLLCIPHLLWERPMAVALLIFPVVLIFPPRETEGGL